MKKYICTGEAGFTTVVYAETEAEARHLAMCERWGDKPDGKVVLNNEDGPNGTFRYYGWGLTVKEEKI